MTDLLAHAYDVGDVRPLIHLFLARGAALEAALAWAQHADFEADVPIELGAAVALVANDEIEAALVHLASARRSFPGVLAECSRVRALRLAATAPLARWIAAIDKRDAQGARIEAEDLARDAAENVPLAAKALATRFTTTARFTADWLSPLASLSVDHARIATLLDDGVSDTLEAADRLLDRSLPLRAKNEDAAVLALHALARHLGRTPDLVAGAYRAIALTALVNVRGEMLPSTFTAPFEEAIARIADATEGAERDRWLDALEAARLPVSAFERTPPRADPEPGARAIELLEAGEHEAAFEILCETLPRLEAPDGAKLLAALEKKWPKKGLPPFGYEKAVQECAKLLDKQDAKGAERCARWCAARDRGNVSLMNHASTLVHLGRLREAVEAYSAIDVAAGPGWAIQSFSVAGRRKEALAIGRYLRECNAAIDRTSLLNLGVAAWHAQDNAMMAWAFREADELRPLPAQQLNGLANGLQGTGQWDALRPIAGRLLASNDPIYVACGASYLSFCLLAAGDPKGALREAKRAREINTYEASNAEYEENIAKVKKSELPPIDPPPKAPPSLLPTDPTQAEATLARTAGALTLLPALERFFALDLLAPCEVRSKPGTEGEDDEDEDDEREASPQNPLRHAMANAGLKEADLDERELMPLSNARKLVSSVSEFRRGEGEDIGGVFVWESDRVWAALLSLADAAEFVREAKRLQWFFHPRGFDNVDLFVRYGAGLVPWLASRVDAKGVLHNVPWCVVPCLLAIEESGALAALWGATSVNEKVPTGPGPYAPDAPGDDDVREADDGEDESPVDALVLQWLVAHPKGWAWIAERAGDGDARAKKLLKQTAARSPQIVAFVPPALQKKLKLSATLTDKAILEALDEAAEGRIRTPYIPWPLFQTEVDGRFEYYALRLIGARERGGEGWGVLLDRLGGTPHDHFQLERHRFGSHVAPGRHMESEPALDFDPGEPDDPEYPDLFTDHHGAVVKGPDGAFVLTEDLIEEKDLRPTNTTEEMSAPGFATRVRAYLAMFPGSLWDTPEEAVKCLGLGEDPEIIVLTEAFEHATGDDLPSTSKTYRSLATALVQRKPAAFRPGEPNTDWRLHATFDVEDEGGSDDDDSDDDEN